MSYGMATRDGVCTIANLSSYSGECSDPHRATWELRHALVVDDSPVNRKIAGLHLRAFGFSVTFAHDGQEAISKCSSDRFDLILMDVVLPGLSGLEVAKLIRRKQPMRWRAPIILGWSTSATWQECKAAGMDGTLPKPLDAKALQMALMHFDCLVFASARKLLPAVCFV